MEDRSNRRPPLRILIGVITIALTAGSATALYTWRSISPNLPENTFPEIEIEGEVLPEGVEAPAAPSTDAGNIDVPNPPEVDVAAGPSQQEGTVYWVLAQEETLALAPAAIDLPASETPETALSLAFADLMNGPADSSSEAATAIPEQTELLALTVESDGVHVDLSEDFKYGGGSAAMMGRLAQVIYTATALEPDASVWLSVEGQPLTILGGEGLLIRQPITRSDLAADFGVEGPSN